MRTTGDQLVRHKLEHHRYHRDRRVEGQLSELTGLVAAVCLDSDPRRVEHYRRALALLAEAAATFREGWRL